MHHRSLLTDRKCLGFLDFESLSLLVGNRRSPEWAEFIYRKNSSTDEGYGLQWSFKNDSNETRDLCLFDLHLHLQGDPQ